ncbi:MAG: 50S ribosomal protein L22, partial [Candidatus Yonathbacteria bacterium]|nr:50S ribosomal protein L22 [Candidatus Yonathbacteria bacterium]
AILKNYRQSPRKVRLVADFLRGKNVSIALQEVNFITKRASHPIKKLIESAAANAKENFGIEKEDLVIKEIQVNKGFTLKRSLPRAFGRASAIHKHSSHVSIILDIVNKKHGEGKMKEGVETKSKEALLKEEKLVVEPKESAKKASVNKKEIKPKKESGNKQKSKTKKS